LKGLIMASIFFILFFPHETEGFLFLL